MDMTKQEMMDELAEYRAVIPELAEANAVILGAEEVKAMIEAGMESEIGVLCAYCGHPSSDKEAAQDHAQVCPANPLVRRVLRLEAELEAERGET